MCKVFKASSLSPDFPLFIEHKLLPLNFAAFPSAVELNLYSLDRESVGSIVDSLESDGYIQRLTNFPEGVSRRVSSIDSRNFHINPLPHPRSLNIRLTLYSSQGFESHHSSPSSKRSQEPVWHVCGGNQFMPLVRLALFIVLLYGGTFVYLDIRNERVSRLGLILCGIGFLVGLAPIPWDLGVCYESEESYPDQEQTLQHNAVIVPQKYLDFLQLLGYSNSSEEVMANVLNTDKKIAIIGALTEGSSIRSIERMTGVHRDTIMRLGVKVGQGCTALMDSTMRNLSCQRLEMDEIWGFIGKKERNVKMDDSAEVGSVWTWCAIDADTKLVPAFLVGDRSKATANAFAQDVASRMAYRVQISTDGFHGYAEAIEKSFGANVDYAQIIKIYGTYEFGERRYSSSGVLSSEKHVVTGRPDVDLISTSYVERLNATTRTHMRRLTRLTLAFSKKRENFVAAVGLHFAYYNFVKRHNTLRCTPAMAAGVTGTTWSVGDLVEATA